MKTLNIQSKIIAVSAISLIAAFAVCAAVHIVQLTEAGLIHWNR